MSDKLKFKVSSGIKDIVGKDLITDDNIAVFELVKNSYDARADKVVIEFTKDKIVIADNGKGMTLDDIKTKWLYLAYSAKKNNSEDSLKDLDKSYRDDIQSRTHYAGAKGIGRFSVDRLGESLTLTTRSRDGGDIEQIKLNWNDFSDQDVEFGTVDVDHFSLDSYDYEFPENSSHGVILEIGQAREWSREEMLSLKHSLEKLINPFSDTDDFGINIVCEREKGTDEDVENNRWKVNGSVKNSIREILDIKTTHISVTLMSEEIITKIHDRGTLIYHISEPNIEFTLLDDLKIDLYFLNQSAKNNFTRRMGIPVVNFGSVFLFKNGFRVQPYGKKGDDSWGLDYRSQSGYNRFLATRNLFGRVDITTSNSVQFKEVSSRDGGLVKTEGYHQLMVAFMDKALIRLERYVVGVLWGEGFKRRNYFGKGSGAQSAINKYRDDLKKNDQTSESVQVVTSNLGSKIDFVQLIKGLTLEKDVEIIDFNKEFIDMVNEKLDDLDARYIADFDEIADKLDDQIVKAKLTSTKLAYDELIKAKKQAEERAIEEERKRKEAEKKQQEEERRRKEAEKKQQEAEKKRIEAENAKLRAENEEFKAKEEAAKEKVKRETAEKESAIKGEQIERYKAAETVDYKDLRDSNHIIGVYSDDISKKMLLLKRKLDKKKVISNEEFLEFIQEVSMVNEKISTLTKFTTKSGYLQAKLETEEDIVGYISSYVKNNYAVLYKIEFEIIGADVEFEMTFQPIELCVALDNILSNSRRKGAKKVIFEFSISGTSLLMQIRDVGKILSSKIADPELIFDEGVTSTNGAGLGLNHVKRIVEDDLGGTIWYNPDYTNGFELIIKLDK